MSIINSVIKGGGITPTGTKNITANGVYDVTNFASADVQVPTTAPAYYVEKTKDANNKLVNGSSTVINLTGITDVGDFALNYAYYGDTNIIGNIDLSSLTTISGQNALANTFERCTGITSVDLSSLTTISGLSGCQNMFASCTGLTSVDLSSLTTVSGNNGCQNMFSGCTSLASVDLSSLATITGSNAYRTTFYNCTSLTSLSFPALTSTSFGSYTNQFNSMLSGITGCTVHFPSNLQSVIGSWSDVTSGFGGTNTTVLFDLPATVILTGANYVNYERNPKYDTATALGWYINGTDRFATQYYTSGTADPQVGDTIYSDSACTTAVTTISSIA